MTEASPLAALEVDPMDQTEVIEVSHLSRRLEAEFATPVKPPCDKAHVEPGDEHMKVYLRIRPFSDSEVNIGENQGCFQISSEHVVLAHAPKDSHTFKSSKHGLTKSTHKFTFSSIFNEKTSQKEFFDSTMLGTVKDFVDGQNCLVFTYGVTNAGKTYTIQGEPKDAGILPRALDVLFNSIEGRQWESMSLKPQMFCDVKRLTAKQMEEEADIKEAVLKRANDDDPDVGQMMGDETTDVSRLTSSTMSEDSLMAPREGVPSSKPDAEEEDAVFEDAEGRVREDAAIDVESQGQIRFSVWVSFLELYNEQVFDLLEPMTKKKNARRNVLQLREDKRGIPYVKGLKELQVTSADEAYKLLTIGQKNLQTACTRLNHNSSRSHCIFNIKLLRVVDKEDPRVARVSMLSLCDLAGSERWTKTQSFGDRIKEAANINTSLLTLGKCIKILRHNQQYRDNPHIVPFRESKITRIFQSFFSGKGKASMIVNINQCASMFDETLHALKYSAVAKQVIVTQEQEKPPPLEKRRPKNKSSRLVSLALSQANEARMSIPWATPGTLKTLAEMEEQAAANAIPEEDEDLDSTFTSDKETELLEVIEHLKEALKEEKRNNLKIEGRVRVEVCNEMAEQLVEIERNYSDMLKDERARAEERAEKRVEMYMQSVKKKSTKRKRAEDDHDIETVPLTQVQALQAKLQDREGDIIDLRDKLENFESEIEQLQASLKAAIHDKDDAIQETSKLKFNISALKMDLDNANKSGNSSSADLSQAGMMQSLSNQVQQLKDELKRQNDLNKELSDMLAEAGETFEENQSLIKQLKATISSYEKRVSKDTGGPIGHEQVTTQLGEVISKLADVEVELDTKQKEAASLTQQLADAESVIEELKKKRQSVGGDRMLVKGKHAAEFADLESQVAAQEEQVRLLRQELEDGQDIAKLQKEKEILEDQISQSISENKKEIAKLEQVVTEHKSLLKYKDSTIEELNTQVKELQADAKEKETMLEQTRSEASELKVALEDLQGTLSTEAEQVKEENMETDEKPECKTEESSSESNVGDKYNKQEIITKLEKKLSYGDLSMNITNINEVTLADLTDNIEKLQELLDRKHNELSKESRKSCQLEIKILGLEESLKQANSELRKKGRELANRKEEIQQKVALITQLHNDLETARSESKKKEADIVKIDKRYQNALTENNTIGTKVSENEKLVRQLQDALRQSELKVADLQNQLDDYIYKVNEQAVEMGDLEDKMSSDKKTLKDIKNKLTTLEGDKVKLNEAIIEKDSTITDLRNKVTCLETKINSERKLQTCAKTEIDDLLQDKAVLIEELNTKVETLSRNLNQEQKLHAECRAELDEATQGLSTLKQQGESESAKYESAREKYECDFGKLKEQLASAQEENVNMRGKYDSKCTQVEALEKEVASMKVTVDSAEDSHLALTEMQNELKSAKAASCEQQQECAKLKEEVSHLTNQVDDLKSAKLKQEANRRMSDANMVDFAAKVKNLERQVSDTEYRAQMTSRQLRREKNIVEQALKEAQQSLEEATEKIQALQEKVNSASDIDSSVTDTSKCNQESVDVKAFNLVKANLSEKEKQVKKLEEIIKDLEQCLVSSKEREQKTAEQLEKYRNKCHKLTGEISFKEEQIQTLEVSLNESSAAVVGENMEYKTVIQELEESIDNHRAKCETLDTEKKTLNERLCTVEAEKNDLQGNLSNLEKEKTALEEKVSVLEIDCSKLTDNISSLMKDNSFLKEKVSCLEDAAAVANSKVNNEESENCAINDRIVKLEQDNELLRSNVDTYQEKMTLLQSEINSYKVTVMEFEHNEHNKSEKGAESESSTSKENVLKLEEIVSEQKTVIEKMKEDQKEQKRLHKSHIISLDEINTALYEKEADLEGLREDYNAIGHEKAELSKKCAKLESRVEKLKEDMKSLLNEKADCEKVSMELEDKCTKLETQSSKKETELEKARKEVLRTKEVLEADLKDKEALVKELQERLDRQEEEARTDVKKARNEVNTVKAEVEGLRRQIKSLENEGRDADGLKSEISTLNSELDLLRSQNNSLIEARREAEHKASEQKGRLEGLMAELGERRVAADNLTSQITQLKAQVAKSTELETAAKTTVTDLRYDLDVKEKTIESMTEQVQQAKAIQLEYSSVMEDLKQTKEREENLRKQLTDSNKWTEEDNTKIRELQDRLREEETSRELAEKRECEASNKVKALQLDFSQREKDLEAVKREKTDLETKLDAAEKSLTRQEARIKSRNETVEELVTKLDNERKGFEVALKDAKSNEALMEELRKVAEEQEATMELQDQTIKGKENELEALQKELNLVLDKCHSLQTSSKESGRGLRLLEQQFNQAKADKDQMNTRIASVEKENATLISQVHEMEQLSEQEAAVAATEKNSLEAELAELRRECSKKDNEKQRNANIAAERSRLESDLERARTEKVKGERERGQLEADLKTAKEELHKLQELLTESQKEVAESQKEVASLQSQQAELKQSCSQATEQVHAEEQVARDKDNTLQRLRHKFQALENENHASKEEINSLQAKVVSAEKQKQKELEEWRKKRDQLVAGLEQVLKQKDAEIQQLQDSHKPQEDSRGAAEAQQAILNLQAQLRDRDETIAQLSTHLESKAPVRARRGRRTVNVNNEDDDNLRREVAIMHQQLEQERADHKHELNKVVRAKDIIIDELKDANGRLCRNLHLSLTPQKTCQDESIIVPVSDQGCSTESPNLNDVLLAPRRATRGRPRRRLNSEASEENEPATKRVTKSAGRGRRKTAAQKSSASESADIISIKEESAVDLSMAQPRTPMDELGNRTAEKFISPKIEPEDHPPSIIKKRKLRTTMPDPFAESPQVETTTSAPARRLRSRRH